MTKIYTDVKLNTNTFIEKFNKANELREVKLRLLNPEVIEEFVNAKAQNDQRVDKTTNIKFEYICEKGHHGSLTVYSRLLEHTYVCTECALDNRRLKRLDVLKNKLTDIYGDRFTFPNIDKEYIDELHHITGVCSIHGEFKQIPKKLCASNIDIRQNCRYCKDKIRDDAYQQSDAYISIFNKMKLKMTDLNKNGNEHQDIECLLCGNIFNATPKSKVTNYKQHGLKGCATCTKNARYADARTKNINYLLDKFDILEDININDITNYTKIKVRNKSCGHEFSSRMGNLVNRNVNCGVCNLMRDKYHEELHLISVNNKSEFQKYMSDVNFYTNRNYKNYKHIINPNNYERKLIGKEDGYHLDHIISKKFCYLNNIPAEVCAHQDNLRMISSYENVAKSSKIHTVTEIPDIFYDYIHSMINLIEDFDENIEELFDDSVRNYISDNYKLTLYSEDNKIGFVLATFKEYAYSNFFGKTYFRDLKNHFKEIGINVIIIFEDEWIYNKDKVLARIKHIVNKSDAEKIYARQCIVKQIESSEKTKFLNTYHIQNSCKSNISYGAYYNDELVAVMTFGGDDRFGNGNKHNHNVDMYELTRFAVSYKYTIVAIASKLLNHFIEDYNPKIIFSYADNRWSNGNLYDKLGFELTETNNPNYHYIENGRTYHRLKYRKAKIKEKFPDIYDENKTEEENMILAGLDKIYNAGMMKYTLTLE